MSLPASWVQAPVAKALGLTLAHFVWEGAAIGLALAAVLRRAGRRAAIRYALACSAMAAMVVSFGLTLAHFRPAALAGPAVALRGLSAAGGLGAGPTVPAEPAAGLAEQLVWVVPFWAAGVLIFYLHGLGGWIVARRLRRTGVTPAPDDWQARLGRLRQRLRVSRPVALMESCLAEAPVVIGFLRPVILLPIGLLTGLGAQQVEAILIHELAHVRRCDYLVSLLQKFVEGLLFYHPAVWWVSGLIREERENCCDDVVVRVLGDAHGYAATLATLEEIRWSAREPALAATGGNLMRRVRRLLNQPEGPRPSAVPVFSAAILLAAAAALLGAWQTAPQQQAAPKQLTEKQKREILLREAEGPYLKWLREDVVYIITDEERTAYQRLQSDEERDKFIEQFWLRRDPTPATVENEFKEEHYRRIAYSNQHFAAAVPGWKTDQGRIHIIYGPPDEKEAHPAERYEEWLYRYIEGVGENVIVRFVKGPEDGAIYRMAADPKVK
jgi:GWxTD domain-containing protein